MVSSGSSGFWFCNWVVSSVRKVWKLPAIVSFELDDELLVLDDDVVERYSAWEWPDYLAARDRITSLVSNDLGVLVPPSEDVPRTVESVAASIATQSKPMLLVSRARNMAAIKS